PARRQIRRVSRARALQPHSGLHRSGRRANLLHGSSRTWRPTRISGDVPELHLLRGFGHGKPRAARRRALLRIGRQALGESLRALDGPMGSGGRRPDDEARFPEGESASLKFTLKAPKQFTLALRRPSWAGDGFAVKVNGQAVKALTKPGSYIELKRKWKSGDTVAVTLTKTLRLEPTPDNARVAAILWGPLVLAGDLGPERERRGGRAGQAVNIPALVAAERPLTDWLKPVSGKPGNFHSDGVGREQDVELMPFYRLHRHLYSVYWDLFTPAEWD